MKTTCPACGATITGTGWETTLNLQFTLDLTTWYARGMLFVMLTIFALAAWGFYNSLAGQKLLKEEFFQ